VSYFLPTKTYLGQDIIVGAVIFQTEVKKTVWIQIVSNSIGMTLKTQYSTSKVAGQHELGQINILLLVDFLVHNSGKKIMVYFATCACVDYWV
ncbi:hypothetical protein ACJX0J_013879, partial [Zea mays]